MKNIILLFLILFGCKVSFGQNATNTIKYPVTNKQLIIDVQEASFTIEGYTGNDLVITSAVMPVTADSVAEAAGLSLIASAVPKEDNVIHTEVLKNDVGVFSIRILKSNCRHLHIMVPKNAYLKVSFTNPWPDADALFKNLSGNLEVDGSAQVMQFNYISGPLILSAAGSGITSGAAEKIIIANLQIPKGTGAIVPFINIQVDYADVDISLPPDTRETFQVNTSNGNFFSGLPLVVTNPKPRIPSEFVGELNGGGRFIYVSSGFGDVFIRKQQ